MHPYRVEHLAHLELQMTMWMPVALWCLHRTLAWGRLRDGLATGAAFGAQYVVGALLRHVSAFRTCSSSADACGSLVDVPLKPLRSLAAGAVLAAVMFAPVFAVYMKTKPYMGNRAGCRGQLLQRGGT